MVRPSGGERCNGHEEEREKNESFSPSSSDKDLKSQRGASPPIPMPSMHFLIHPLPLAVPHQSYKNTTGQNFPKCALFGTYVPCHPGCDSFPGFFSGCPVRIEQVDLCLAPSFPFKSSHFHFPSRIEKMHPELRFEPPLDDVSSFSDERPHLTYNVT